MSQSNKKLLQEVSGKLVDPDKIDYRYLLSNENKSVLLSLAKIAGIDNNKISAYSKENLANYLSIEIPKELNNLVHKLNSKDRLACELVSSAGGYMSLWEVTPRVSIETKKQEKARVDSTKDKHSVNDGWKKKQKDISFGFISMVDKDEEDEEQDYYYNYDDKYDNYSWMSDPILYGYYNRRREISLLDLFGFCRFLSPYDPRSDSMYKRQSSEPYFLIPKEARSFFKTRSTKLEIVPLHYDQNTKEPRSLQAPQLLDLMQSLLDDISLRPPKPTPKLGLLPKSTFLPIFEKHVSKSQAYKGIKGAKYYFDWKVFNETLTAFAYDKKLIKKTITEKNTERVEIIPQNVSKIMSNARLLNEAFLQWWAQGKNNAAPFLFKSKMFEFDPGIKRLRSDEIKSRQILYEQIRNEMKPDTLYYTSTLLDKCEIKSGARLFRNDFGLNVYGPQGLITDNEILREFISNMIIFPLCLLGIIETNNSKTELVSLGRWGKSPLSMNIQSDSLRQSRTSSSNNGLITVTPNFEVILQTQSPEGRSLAFHLREFCNLQNKSDPNLDPVQIFSLSKESVVRSLRTGNYTWQKIVSLLTDAAYPSDVPQNVKHELRTWGERYGEITIKTIEVLDCKDEIIAESLLSDPVIKKQILARVGKTTIEIKSGSRSKILLRCDKLGYLIKP
ncbi:MAG: helicase-associated domain-containing protein [Candidatus Nitrosocosmicus sp.]|nr:helicase-associated domain-containing protein [Candidatus Nitrosocosmicus sp.]